METRHIVLRTLIIQEGIRYNGPVRVSHVQLSLIRAVIDANSKLSPKSRISSNVCVCLRQRNLRIFVARERLPI